MPVCPKCGQTSDQLGGKCPRDEFYFISEAGLADAKHDPFVGTLAADKYVILSLINEGGMGAVYRALQLPVEREVAFKVLRAELKDSDQGQDRFIREARAVSRLNHPNIITLHDFGFDEQKHPFMVMEYAPGKSLADWLKDEEVTTDRLVHIGEQVLSALTDAHEEGIVHRDLKPENMIITKSGNDYDFVKLLDFGIARLINEGSTKGLTREGEVFGTPHYMAPEQAQGQKTVGPPADVYAVGIMLYEMITGRCPFDAPTPLSVLFMHINEPLPPIEPRNGVTLTQGLRDVVATATAKDVQDRYQSAGEMLTALQSGVPKGVSSLGSVVGDLRNNTIAPGSQPLDVDSTKPMNRQPQMTPMPAADVGVYDPEPSVERPVHELGASKYEQPYDTDAMVAAAAGSRTRLGLVAAISVLALFLLGGVVYGLVSEGEPEIEEKGETETIGSTEPNTVEPKDEVAVKEPAPRDPDETRDSIESGDSTDEKPSEEEPSDAEKEALEKAAAEKKAAEKEAAEKEAAEKEAARKAAEKEAAEKAERQARREAAAKNDGSKHTAASTKPADKSDEKQETDKPAETKDSPKKFEPKKFAPKDTRKW